MIKKDQHNTAVIHSENPKCSLSRWGDGFDSRRSRQKLPLKNHLQINVLHAGIHPVKRLALGRGFWPGRVSGANARKNRAQGPKTRVFSESHASALVSQDAAPPRGWIGWNSRAHVMTLASHGTAVVPMARAPGSGADRARI
jgi:hypothetical protein